MRQGIRDFAKCCLNRLLVLRHRNVAAYRGDLEVCAVGATVKDRQRDLRREAPATRAALEQIRELAARSAGQSGETNARIEGRARRANVGIGRLEVALGLQDVGTTLQELRGKPRRDIGQRVCCRSCAVSQGLRQQFFRHFGAHEQHQCIAVLRYLRGVAFDVHARAVDTGLRLAQRERRGHAQLEAALVEAVGVTLAL
ncbi:hypothetical protein FQZ97_891970 [compost metagenome]